MNPKLATMIYFIVLLFSFALSAIRQKLLKKADKVISLLLLSTILSELCSRYAIYKFKNNMYIYHVWSPIELFLIAFYFNEQIKALKKYNVGIIIGLVGVALACVNAVFWQPLKSINSIFLLYEGFAIIGLCLFAFYRLVLNETEIVKNAHFWFTTILLVYWSVVFVYWGMYGFFLAGSKNYMELVTNSLWIINILSYAGISVVFLKYKKMVSISG